MGAPFTHVDGRPCHGCQICLDTSDPWIPGLDDEPEYLSFDELTHIARAHLVDRFGPVPTPGAWVVISETIIALHEAGALPMHASHAEEANW